MNFFQETVNIQPLIKLAGLKVSVFSAGRFLFFNTEYIENILCSVFDKLPSIITSVM
jgi:hypothetical protein